MDQKRWIENAMPLNNLPDDSKSFPPTKVNESDRKKLKQIYISLILIGLMIGGLLSVGIVFAMNRFGLTQRPSQVERQQG